ncbi:MAG: TonB-dependent receptor [Bacteroidales bacterium]|nr:TonB-dependent receptor [Bacteroidales bacterium]
MKRVFTMLFFSLLSLAVFAQGRVITGKVTDSGGAPLPGVTIILVGTSTGTTTDVEGTYKITVNEGVLRFSYVGFVAQDFQITNQTTIDVVLEEEASLLNEVVVVGYGTQKKKDITTAVSVVDDKEIKERPIVSAAQALQGKAAGVQVTQPSGKPGVGLSVRVRGSTSVIAGNEPLYVIDGVPTTNTSGLNPSDIASMTVLKDASSSAIYGARAANGVVLITTKRGEAGTGPTVNFDAYAGFSKLRKTIEVLNTKEYRDLMEDIGIALNPAWTSFGNWSDSVFGTGFNQSYQLSFSGGSEKTHYFFSAGYLSDAGMVEPARFDRYSVRLNLDNEVTKWLKFGTSINMSRLRTLNTPDNLSSGRGGVIMSTLNTPPFLSIWDKDSIGWYGRNPFQASWENPVAYMFGADQEAIDNNLFGNVFAEVKIIPGLFFKTRFGIDYNNHQWDYFLDGIQTSWGRTNKGLAQADKSNYGSWLWENTLDYSKSFKDHNITAMIGGSGQQYNYNQTYLQGHGFRPGSSVHTLNAANETTGSTWQDEWALASFFARATYNFKSKYYLTATVREDGSSKLNHHWGTMPSFSAGWRISSEKFMQNSHFVDDLKIRGGWGKNGNQEGIPNNARFGLIAFSPSADDPYPSEYPISYGNIDLKWETTEQTNIGIDLSMFNFRVNLSVDAYYKKTTDVLLNVELSNTLPVTTMQTNAGNIENKGIEFTINTVNINKKLTWSTDLNMSFNRNKVLSLNYTPVYYFGHIYSNNSDVSMVKPGLPLGSFYGLVSEGVDPETGDLIYKDVNQNGIFEAGADRTVIGDPNPDFIFGFTNTFNYWKFDLNIFFQGSVGNDIYNSTRIDLEGMFDSKNQSVDVLRRWIPENPDTDIPRPANMDNVRNSTRFIEDGSYVRLKAVTLSYKVFDNNSKITFVRQFTVYVTGQNLLTFTGYSGFDPEVNAYGNNATEVGIDYGTYPQSVSLIFGLNVQF